MVMDDSTIEAIVSMLMDLQNRENVNVPLYEQQLRETEASIRNILNAIQQGILTKSTKSHRKMLIDTFVNSIYLYDDKMLLTFSFKESTKTITFDDVRDVQNKCGNGSDFLYPHDPTLKSCPNWSKIVPNLQG